MATKDITDAQVVAAYAEYHRQMQAISPLDAEWAYDILMRETGQPFKVCYRAMERASIRGLISYGISLRTGWVTDEGRALLAVNCSSDQVGN